MKAFLDCVPCILSQVTRLLTNQIPDPKTQQTLLQEILYRFSSAEIYTLTPPKLTTIAHDVIRAATNNRDLYLNEKIESNNEALLLYPSMKEQIFGSKDPLLTAAKSAIAGNLIDYGALREFEMSKILTEYAQKPLEIDDSEMFLEELEKSTKILYIADNAGEIIFDKLFIELLLSMDKRITVAVKSEPILNDALFSDAVDTGLSQIVPVIKSGSVTAGTTLAEATIEFTAAINDADMIISKGQGNLETLSEEQWEKPLFYFLLSKCPHISERLGIQKFDLILCSHERFIREYSHYCDKSSRSIGA